MIPSMTDFLLTELEVESQPTKNYKMNIDDHNIKGHCDELDAMVQVIYKILNTERYEYIIYSWDYGIETVDLYGEPVTYVCPEIQRRVEEALLQDDRIDSVDDFEFDVSEKGKVKATFTVHTIYGDAEIEKVVNF